MNVYEGLYNPHTDRRTILNPPMTSWESQWGSLGNRVLKVAGRQNDSDALFQKDSLRSDVQESARPEERTTVNKLQAQMPNFAKAQVQHLYAMLGQMNTYRLYLRGIFAFHFNDKLTQSRHFSPSNVNRSLLRQVTTDLRIIEQAISQRLPVNDTFMWDSHMLYLSDLMAYDALQPLKEAGIVPQETAIVTYMQRQTDIRMTPYYHAVLLGLPSSTSNKPTSPPDEFLAIPHEIGHYLYRYGALDQIPRKPEELIDALAKGAGWTEDETTELLKDTELKNRLKEIVPSTPVPCVEMAATVRKIVDAVKLGIKRLPSAATEPTATADSSSKRKFTPGQLENISWHSLHTLLRTYQKARTFYLQSAGDEPDENLINTQALLEALRSLGADSEENVEAALNSQNDSERKSSAKDAQQLNPILRARIIDLHTSVERMLEAMPKRSPDRSVVQYLHQGLQAYTQMPKQKPEDVIPMPEQQVVPPSLTVDDARHILTPRIHEVLTKKLEDLHLLPTDWRRHWVEELFCDAYGCLIAGPINVLGFQILLSDEQYENDHLHRGKHPVASLRPFILSEMLREMDRRGAASYERAPDLMDLHWQNHLRMYGEHDQRLNILETLFTPEGQMPALTGQQVIDGLQIVIDQIFDLFAEIFSPSECNTSNEQSDSAKAEKKLTLSWTPWTKDVTINMGDPEHERIIAGVMRQFQNQNEYANYYSNKDLKAALKSVPTVTTQRQTVTPALQRASTLADSLANYSSDHRMPVADWFEVFAVDGWSTEGPRGSTLNP